MTSPKILVLVIYNETALELTDLYKNLKQQWLRYMNSNPSVKSYFICMKQDLEQEHLVTEDTVFIRGTESYIPGIHVKSCESIKVLLNNSEFSEVEYVVRTNISSFWIWDRLIQYLKNIPRTNVISAVIGNHSGIRFPSGSGFIMSRDVALLYSQMATHPTSFYLQDDVVLGQIASENNISIIESPRFDIPEGFIPISLNFNMLKNSIFHIRNHHSHNKLRISSEAQFYKHLVDHYCN
jgi:hypothetical protein